MLSPWESHGQYPLFFQVPRPLYGRVYITLFLHFPAYFIHFFSCIFSSFFVHISFIIYLHITFPSYFFTFFFIFLEFSKHKSLYRGREWEPVGYIEGNFSVPRPKYRRAYFFIFPTFPSCFLIFLDISSCFPHIPSYSYIIFFHI